MGKTRFFLLYILLSLGAFLLPSHTNAQGTFGCRYNSVLSRCVPFDNNCDTNYGPDQAVCASKSAGDCATGTYTCVTSGSGNLSCSSILNGACRTRQTSGPVCGDGNGFPTTAECGSPDQVCCTTLLDPPRYSPRGSCGDTSLDTGIGCLPVTTREFMASVFPWALGISTGIAFIMIIVASIQIVMAGGDPKRVKAGQELLTAAIIGVAFIALSVIILNFVGVTILNLPGFVGNPML